MVIEYLSEIISAFMNTRLVMSICALTLGITGMFLTFAPDITADSLHIESSRSSHVLIQIIGALYFGYGMLNWMTKESLIGGIYNRPIANANFCHFLIAGVALVKLLISNPNASPILWITGIVYTVFAILFTIILYRHPVKATAEQK